MAISSRLALWEQKIREEDRSPPPTSPPPVFSAIPGGFIKQLVRETEKESKEAKLKEKNTSNTKEDPPGKPADGSVIKDTTNLLEVGGSMANSKCPGRLNGEKHGGESLDDIPERKPSLLKRAIPRIGSKQETVPAAPKPGEKLPSDPPQPPKTATPEQTKGGSTRDPGMGAETAKKVPSVWSKRLESLGKENVKARTKEESVGRPGIRAKGANKGESKDRTGEPGRKMGEKKEKAGETEGKSGEKMEETGKKLGGKKEKAGETEGKSGENAEKTEETRGKVGGKKEKPEETGEEGREKKGKIWETWGEMGETKEKMGETVKKLGETKEKMGETGEKLGETKDERGEIGRKMEGTREKMGEMGEKLGGKKEKMMGIKLTETEEKMGETGGKPGGKKGKLGENGGKLAEKSGGNGGEPAEAEDIKKETRRKMEPEPSEVETGEKTEENGKLLAGGRKYNLRECTDSLEKAGKEDLWYETEKVWLLQKDGFALATELKPDIGTPDLPPGMVRIRMESDGSVFEVDEGEIQKTNPPRLDYAEDLASLVSLNESSVVHTLRNRFQSQLVYTYAGPDLVAIEPYLGTANSSKKAFKGKRDGMPPHIFSVAQRAYWSMLSQRQDQTIIPLGRTSSGKTTCCQNALEYLVEMAGSVDNRVTVEKIQAMFSVLRAFGAVSTSQNRASTRFSMVMALDFNANGRITGAHLQTMLLERIRVAQQPEGESNFNVFKQMLAGIDLDQRTLLHLHQTAESNSFGLSLKVEEKQALAAAFSQLRAALGTLGIGPHEQEVIWRVLAGIFHLGAAGVCKVGRKQFMKFESANNAAEILGCDYEELTTAVFKHHLRRILEQATAGRGGHLKEDEDPSNGPKMTAVECVEGMVAGLYEELFAAIISLINRSFSCNLLSLASVLVVDSPGFHNPRRLRQGRAATFEEFCHNYAHERLEELFFQRTFVSALERYREENVEMTFDLPNFSPAATVALVDQNSSQLSSSGPASQGHDPRGFLWILEEEALIHGGDGAALDRLCASFATEATETSDGPLLRKCEQPLHFEVGHQFGAESVRYDATGWVGKAKWNLSVENAARVLQTSKIENMRELFFGRSKVPLVCRSIAGLDGNSHQALQRAGCVRKTFATSFAAVKKKSACAQIKLQMDAVANLVKRSQIHFIHCLQPRTVGDGVEEPTAAPWDFQSLRAQLSGGQILDALRLHRIGYADRMALTQFRRHFQILAQPVMRKYTSAYETPNERKALEELFHALDLEKKSVAVGRTQVFLKAGVLSRLEKQREKVVTQNLPLLQAACKGFLSRQKYRELKVQRLAARCIQRNLLVFQRVRAWPWWGMMGLLRPWLTNSRAEGQLRAKEEELLMLKKKLETSEFSRQKLQQSLETLETKVIDLTTELSDERLKGEAACRILDGERAERLQGSREIKELQIKHEELQKKLEAAEKLLEETQEQLELREVSGSRRGEEWQMRLDCTQTEIGFLRKRVGQLEEWLEAEKKAREEAEGKWSEAQKAYEGACRAAQQLRRKCKRLTCELEDARVLMENQQSRNHELEKKQKKFDMQLAQALGESAFEKSLREKVAQENTGLQYQLGKAQRSLEQKELENAHLNERVGILATRVNELGSSSGLDLNTVATLRKKLWDLEESSSRQEKKLSLQAKSIEDLEQLHLRLELEIERKRQLHQKELEDKEEELEDVRQSCQKRLRQLEMQCVQEAEEKQRVVNEKRDLEGLIATLCDQIGHRDFDVEKRLRRDLKRTHALLADVQILLETSGSELGPTVSKEEMQKLRSQWEESVARCHEAQKSQKRLSLELESLHSELENLTRNKNLVDEQLYQVQHEKADLLKRIDEDQEDLNELMEKHKALIAQSAADIAQIRELQAQLEELKKEKNSLQEKLQTSQARVTYLEQAMVERSIVSRQEALICDLENKMAFQSIQIKRFEMLVLRLRDTVLKMGEDLGKAKEGEAREKENAGYYRMRMEEMKADLKELAERELEDHRRRVELEKQVDELSTMRQTLQVDLETSIRRIADLQAALEEVRSSEDEESDMESVQTARESLTSRHDTESQLSFGSSVSLNLDPEGSIRSGMGSASGWSSPSGVSRLNKDQEISQALASPSGTRRRRAYGEFGFEKTEESAVSPSAARKLSSSSSPGRAENQPSRKDAPSVAARNLFSAPSENKLREAMTDDKPPRSSSALSEYVDELRRTRLKDPEMTVDAATPPIYQTAGASSLRRCWALDDGGRDLPAWHSEFSGAATDYSGLARSSSLRSVVSPPEDAAPRRVPKSASYDSLLRNLDAATAPDSSSEAFGSPRVKPWRNRLEASVEESERGNQPLVFESKRFGGGARGEDSDPLLWKIPTLNYERRTGTVATEDIPPAIRKPARKGGGHRTAMSVRFEDQVAPERRFLSGIEALLNPGPREGRRELSDSSSSSSSGSVVSFVSADSVKSRPGVPRAEGEGKACGDGCKEVQRSEAEGKEEDVASVMRKYLGKE